MKLKQRLAIGYIQTKFRVLGFLSKQKAAEKAFITFTTPYIKAKAKGELKNAEKISFSFKGLTIKGHRWNHPQPRKALILHGFGSAGYKFEYYATALAHASYEVLAFDAPAHGESDGKTVNAIIYSEMIQEVSERFGPFDSFLAHSFGGLAISLALEKMEPRPDTRVVLIAPATETTSAIDGAFDTLRIHDPEIRRIFDDTILQLTGKEPSWFSVRRAIRSAKARVLWVHDEKDEITPWADAEKVQQDHHPHIRFLVTKGLGHQKIYHDTGVKNEIISFLS